MRLLITGANGQLGNHMRLVLQTASHQAYFTDIDELNITDAVAVAAFFDNHPIDVVVNCAAYTNVDRAEDDEQTAMLINSTAVDILAQNCQRYNATLIHISTDYVFGGNLNNTPCDEQQQPNPTGAYGRTKLAGEQAILQSGCNHVIIRTAWLYSEYGKNFVKTMLEVTATQPQRKVVIDQVGTPTYAGDLAKAILHIIESGKCGTHPGIYHYSNMGVCSWYDFACAIAQIAGHSACRILPCRSDEFPSKVIRPSYSVLDKSKIITTYGVDVPHWYDSLAQMLTRIKDIS
ncbi:MAG: dTDP-4-dehydrorhamnose reductase [Bacteroidales bacterium]|nr:dTDP-4-dehydrorhamnose reductase [Candidatus Colimorpha onthohippi]